MNLQELEEELSTILNSAFKCTKNPKDGKIVIYTTLVEDHFGELVELEKESNNEDDEDLDEEEELDSVFNPDFDSLDEDE
jgi:hypothetical protein